VYNPRPVNRFGHAMTICGDSVLIFGGMGQACTPERMGTPDPDPTDAYPGEDSDNWFCMPELVKNEKGEAIWYDTVTGEVSTDITKSTRNTLPPQYYGDTWTFNHTRCPGNCHGFGYCNLNFCVCQHMMPPTCNDYKCVLPTTVYDFKVGSDKGHWGYHCGFKGCANTTCYFNYTDQAEYCRHCQYNGHCMGETGLCHCYITHQHILAKHYQDKRISLYGPFINGKQVNQTKEPVPFYAEASLLP